MRTDKANIALKAVMGPSAKKILCRILFPFRNNFILFNVSNKAKPRRVNLDYWDESNNLGDTLSPVVVDYMLAKKNLTREKEVTERRHLYAIGSVLTAGIQDATVWGSGILNASLLYRIEKRKFDVRAVRGPITRAVLMDFGHNVPAVYGDPAILMPEIYRPEGIEKTHKFGLITHKDYDLNRATRKGEIDKNILQINICTDDYKEFVRELLSVEIVISSSLHGIILAESYGVRAVLLKPQIDIIKYSDYYFSTGRLIFPTANTVEEALQIEPLELPNNLDDLREGLKRSFPYDLFS